MNDPLRTVWRAGIGIFLAIAAVSVRAAASNLDTREIIYATGFEAEEGFDLNFTIPGHDGWQANLANDSGKSNGLVDNAFEGQGQQAFIGYTPPNSEEASVFRLSRITPIADFPQDAPVIRFNIDMAIADSTNNERDIFSWSAFNTNNEFLFSLHFDNETKLILYDLNNSRETVSTKATFAHDILYHLEVSMDFHRNLWCATLNETVIANAQPITAQDNIALTFSGIDIVWHIFKPKSPGDNYILFDNYSLVRAGPLRPPSRVAIQGILPDGRCVLRVFGEPTAEYQIEASADFHVWTPIKIGRTSAEDGAFDIVDEEAPRFPNRFYRATAKH